MSYAAITEMGPGRERQNVCSRQCMRDRGAATPPEQQRVTVTASRQVVARGDKTLLRGLMNSSLLRSWVVLSPETARPCGVL